MAQKISDLVDYVDTRLEGLFLEDAGRGLWAISSRSGAGEPLFRTIVSAEVLKTLGLQSSANESEAA